MATANDLLSAQNPLRLACRRGTWWLEVVRLVPVERNVFQPRVQTFEGPDSILGQLRRSPDGQALATGALQLMRGARPDESRIFEAQDGEWLPINDVTYSMRPGAAEPGAGLGGELSELRAELLVLRASHERLKERVLRLERALNGLGSSAFPQRSPGEMGFEDRHTPAARAPAVANANLISGEVAGQAQEELTPFSPPAIGEEIGEAEEYATPGQAADTAGGEAPDKPQDTVEKPLEPASLSDVLSCLRSLLGEQFRLTEQRKPSLVWESSLEDWFLCRMIDNNGDEVAAVLCDLQAAVLMGGSLMMLPEAEIQNQIQRRKPSDDVLAAMSEIGNNLSGPLNQRPGNIHVRARPVEHFTMDKLPWVAEARRIQELDLVPMGKLVTLCR